MSDQPATPDRPPVLRLSDLERDQALEVIRQGFAEGRLGAAELDRRTHLALSATTTADLAALTSDLPGPHQRAAVVPPKTPRRLSPQLRGWLSLSIMLSVIWAISSLSVGHLLHFWPIWPIGIVGAGLLVRSISGDDDDRDKRRRLKRGD